MSSINPRTMIPSFRNSSSDLSIPESVESQDARVMFLYVSSQPEERQGQLPKTTEIGKISAKREIALERYKISTNIEVRTLGLFRFEK